MVRASKLDDARVRHLRRVPLFTAPDIPMHSVRTVREVVPSGFESITRVYHPAGSLRFFDVAASSAFSGSEDLLWMDVRMAIPDEDQPEGFRAPDEGSTPPFTLAAIMENCPPAENLLFAVWDGFDWAEETAPKYKQYYIFEGSESPVDGWPGMKRYWREQSANVILPLTGEWLIATPISSEETIVASGREVAVKLLEDTRLDALEITYDSRA